MFTAFHHEGCGLRPRRVSLDPVRGPARRGLEWCPRPYRYSRSRRKGNEHHIASCVVLEEQAEFLAPDKKWECDESHITVKQGKGSICHAFMGARVEASAARVFELFQRPDYDSMFRIFKVVKDHKVTADNGLGNQEFEVEFDAQWRFWKVSGYCAIPLIMNLDKTTGQIRFFQTKPGFLKVYKGAWRIYELSNDGFPVDIAKKPWFKPPAVPVFQNGFKKTLDEHNDSGQALVCLELDVRPAFVPPPPLNRALKGNTANQVESLFEDLKQELREGTEVVIRGQSVEKDSISTTSPPKDIDMDLSAQIEEAENQKINGLDFGFKFDD